MYSTDVAKHLDVKYAFSDLSCVAIQKKPKHHSYPWMTESDLREAIEERGILDSLDIVKDTELERIARYKALLQPWHEVTIVS
jgi:hypothetical protein